MFVFLLFQVRESQHGTHFLRASNWHRGVSEYKSNYPIVF